MERIVVSGGAARSVLLRRILADVTQTAIGVPQTAEPVLLGSAMLGVVVSGGQPDLAAAAARMCRLESVVEPLAERTKHYHDAKYEAYRLLQSAEKQVRALMSSR